TFSLDWVLIFTAVFFVLLAAWHWPRRREWSLAWVKSGPVAALPVSTVVQGKGKYPPFYYGALLLIVIETIEILGMIVAYFYYRTSVADWPPGDLPLPELVLPTLGTVLLIISI